MLNVGSRVCIVFGTSCNMNCRYCYRDNGKIETPKNLTEHFKDFLRQLTPEKTKAVVASGGEPLLYIDKIKEAFACVNQKIHKKLMTNGLLLTQEIIDYVNDNDIELFLSHDGEITEYNRGVDALKDKKLLDLVRQVKHLVVYSVITTLNCDLIKNYEYIVKKLGHRNFYMRHGVVFPNGHNGYLEDGFDYNTYIKSYLEFCRRGLNIVPYYPYNPNIRPYGINYLLDGTVVAMEDMYVYGNIDMTEEKLKILYREHYKEKLADCDKNCFLSKNCVLNLSTKGKAICRCFKMREDMALGGKYVL